MQDSSSSQNTSPSWQSTLIALALIALVGGIFIVVFEKEGTGEALKVWGALGTLIGVLVGAVPTYFFGQQATAVAKEQSKNAEELVGQVLEKQKETEDQARDATEEASKKQEEAEERAREADAKAKAVLAVADEETLRKAEQRRGDLFE